MTFGFIGVIVGVVVLSIFDVAITKLAEWEIKTFRSKPRKSRRTGFFAVLES